MPLPYPYDALEPYIDAETMIIHHDRLLKGYVDKLNATLENYPSLHDWTLDKLLINVKRLPKELQEPITKYAGGVYNHEMFFSLMEDVPSKPSGELKAMIDRQYGDYDKFMSEFAGSAAEVFGSGYTWLVTDAKGRLRIVNTANQDCPLTYNLCPIICIDIWEHSYFLKYKNLRADYIAAWFNVLNWEKAEQAFGECKRSYKF